MYQHMGEKIRSLRERKGIGLNAFAAKLNVSPGYLSNLETGKTETVSLSLLDRLQTELALLPTDVLQLEESSDFDYRVKRAMHNLHDLCQKHPEAAEHILSAFEGDIDFWKDYSTSR